MIPLKWKEKKKLVILNLNTTTLYFSIIYIYINFLIYHILKFIYKNILFVLVSRIEKLKQPNF